MLLIQEYVKEEHAVHVLTATHTFHYQLFITHMLWVYARMFVHERELKIFAHACDFQGAY
jgi:hypothetical protein